MVFKAKKKEKSYLPFTYRNTLKQIRTKPAIMTNGIRLDSVCSEVVKGTLAQPPVAERLVHVAFPIADFIEPT